MNPDKIIPETGAGGYTPDSHTIFVYFDSTSQHLKQNLFTEIRSTVAHEFHHAIRNRTFNWKEDTLLGAMITEGLADHFDIEVNEDKPKPWSMVLNNAELEKFIELAQPEFNSKEYNYNDWFFGSIDKSIPKWAGYSIGFYLVSDYMKKIGKKASELVKEPAASFL